MDVPGLSPEGDQVKRRIQVQTFAKSSIDMLDAQTAEEAGGNIPPIILRGIIRERREGAGGAKRLRSEAGENFRGHYDDEVGIRKYQVSGSD